MNRMLRRNMKVYEYTSLVYQNCDKDDTSKKEVSPELTACIADRVKQKKIMDEMLC